MYKKIIVPLDGSTLSEGVLPYVRRFARDFNLTVELLHVQEPSDIAPYAPPLYGPEYLTKVASSFAAPTDVQRTVESGKAAETILDLTAKQPDALIAMATHGRSGAKRWLLGSVTEKLLHATKNHLLLVRPAGEGASGVAPLTSVIVPLDGSGLAERVLPIVSECAIGLQLEAVLVRVTERIYTAPPEAFLPVFGAMPNFSEVWEQARAEAEQYLTGKVEHLRAQGVNNVSSIVLEGGTDGAAGEIIDIAQKTPNNLIAMSTQGASGLGRWLMGSVTERVVRYSNDPVLIISARS